MRAKFMILVVLLAALVSGCGFAGGGGQPAATPSPEQISRELVNQLNAHLVSMDPVGYVIDAKFHVVDARPKLGGENKLVEWEILIDCQSQVNTCSKERTAAVLIQALKAKKGNLGAALPETLKDLTIYTMQNMKQTGTVKAKWKEVSQYLNDILSGEQLATRLQITTP